MKGSEEYQLFMDFWNFRQMFHDGEDSEAFWEKMIKAGDEIMVKYSKTELNHFAQELIYACIEDSETRWKKGRKNG